MLEFSIYTVHWVFFFIFLFLLLNCFHLGAPPSGAQELLPVMRNLMVPGIKPEAPSCKACAQSLELFFQSHLAILRSTKFFPNPFLQTILFLKFVFTVYICVCVCLLVTVIFVFKKINPKKAYFLTIIKL